MRRAGLAADPWDLALVQRAEVWDQVRMRHLLDSLLAGYPIGAILLCRVAEASLVQQRQGALRRVVDATEGAWQLLDGQQRINALFCLFSRDGQYGRFLLDMTIPREPPGPTTSRRSKDRALGYIAWQEPGAVDVGDQVLNRNRHLDLSAWLDWVEGEPGRVQWALAELTEDPRAAATILPDVDRGFTAVLDQGQQRVAANRLERLLRLWVEPSIPVMRTEVQSALDVLEVFTRINLGGVQVASTDVYFAAVKTFWPGAEGRLVDVASRLGVLGRIGSLQFVSRLASRGIGQSDLLPLAVDRLAGSRGEPLIEAMDQITAPDSPSLSRIERLSLAVRERSRLGYGLRFVAWQLWDEVLAWAATSATPSDDWWEQNLPLVDAYLLGGTVFRYPTVLGDRYRRSAFQEALSAGLGGERFPLEKILAVARAANPQLRAARQAVRGISAGEDRLWLADRNAGLLLSIAQRIPYSVSRPIDWDHIFPQAQASRMWALADSGRRVHHRHRGYVHSAGNLWGMDASTNRALQDSPPRAKFALIKDWCGSSTEHPVWPADQWFLDQGQIDKFEDVDRALTNDPASIDSAMREFRDLVTARADALLENALEQFPQVSLFAADTEIPAIDPTPYEVPALVKRLGLDTVLERFKPVPVATSGDSDKGLLLSLPWAGREEELKWAVKAATKAHTRSGRALPARAGEEFDFRRYIHFACPASDTYPAVAVMGSFADAGLTPTWLVFRSDTGGFPTVRHRVMSSGLANDVRHDYGHLWLPLPVRADREWQDLADDLIEGICSIRKVVEESAL